MYVACVKMAEGSEDFGSDIADGVEILVFTDEALAVDLEIEFF